MGMDIKEQLPYLKSVSIIINCTLNDSFEMCNNVAVAAHIYTGTRTGYVWSQ